MATLIQHAGGDTAVIFTTFAQSSGGPSFIEPPTPTRVVFGVPVDMFPPPGQSPDIYQYVTPQVVLTGSGLVVSAGALTAGTVNTITICLPGSLVPAGGSPILTLSGLSITAAQYQAAKASAAGFQALMDLQVINYSGSGAADIFTGGGFGDVINGGGEADVLNGGGGADTVDGGTGDDSVNGGVGADTLRGGAGSDTYIVDDAGDVVDESVAGSNGADTVQASIDFSLADPVHAMGEAENLVLTGSAVNATGNGLANILRGNAGSNLLDGLGGADTMQGFAGNDTYMVDDPVDIVDEVAAGSDGIDTVLAMVSFTLGAGVENLTLIGGVNINGTGNELANVLTGNADANVLAGGLGSDSLAGGLGSDSLAGGSGLDSFVFNTALDAASNLDTILDFSPADDTILLDNAIFTKLKTDGALKKKYFEVGKKADDKDDFIVYNKKTGDLFYDKNGDHKGGAILFAHLEGSPDDVSKADFFVV